MITKITARLRENGFTIANLNEEEIKIIHKN